jgi:hypothetical protein
MLAIQGKYYCTFIVCAYSLNKMKQLMLMAILFHSVFYWKGQQSLDLDLMILREPDQEI